MNSRKNVAIAIDGSEDSERVIDTAMQYLDQSALSLKVVVVIPTIPHELAAMTESASINLPLREMQSVFESGMTATAESFAEKYDIPAINVDVLFGRPADEIREYCVSNQINLLVVGLHGTLSRSIGSTTFGLLQNTGCDVLNVRLNETP